MSKAQDLFQPARGTRFVFYPTPGNPYGVEMIAEKYESDGTLLCMGTGHEAHHVYFVTPQQLAQPELFQVLGTVFKDRPRIVG